MLFLVKFIAMTIGLAAIMATIVELICELFDHFMFNPIRNKKYAEKCKQTEEWLAKWGA